MAEVIHSSDDLQYVSLQFDDPNHLVNGSKLFLGNGIADVGTPWGDDVHGKTFGDLFVPSMDHLLVVVLDDVATGLTDIKASLVAMAEQVEFTEAQQLT